MVGYLIIGSMAGMTALVAGLVLGASVWLAFCLYPLVGSSVLLVVSLVGAGRTASAAQGGPVAIRDTVVKADSPSRTGPLALPTRRLGQDQVASTMRILAVDDDPFVLELVQTISATAGFSEVVVAGSGQLALETLARADQPFDCLLFDISMPGMDGIELCRMVRTMPAYRQTPIIMLTAKRDIGNMDRAFQAGASDYATKPFDIVAFGARLRMVQSTGKAKAGATLVAAGSSRRGFGWPSDALTGEGTGVPGLVGCGALVNYLDQLPVAALADARVFAIRIDGMDAVRDSVPDGKADGLLRTVATASADAIGASLSLMAFIDDETLLIATNGAGQAADDLEARIDAASRQSFHGQARVGIRDFGVSVGQPVQLRAARALRAQVAFDRAIGLANRRAEMRQGATRLLDQA